MGNPVEGLEIIPSIVHPPRARFEAFFLQAHEKEFRVVGIVLDEQRIEGKAHRSRMTPGIRQGMLLD